MTSEAWTIIAALATALQAVSIFLFKRVDKENTDLKAELKRRDEAESVIHKSNAELAKKYIERMEMDRDRAGR